MKSFIASKELYCITRIEQNLHFNLLFNIHNKLLISCDLDIQEILLLQAILFLCGLICLPHLISHFLLKFHFQFQAISTSTHCFQFIHQLLLLYFQFIVLLFLKFLHSTFFYLSEIFYWKFTFRLLACLLILKFVPRI